MLDFNNGNITLTRGDSVYINTVILTPCEEVYEPKEDDKIYFIVSRTNDDKFDSNIVIKKEFINRNTKIKDTDTKFLSKGRYYYCCILIQGNGDKQTYCEGYLYLV